METGKTQFEVKAGPPDELTASLKSAKKADSAESPKTDYSAKAVNSTSFSDYWVCYTSLPDRHHLTIHRGYLPTRLHGTEYSWRAHFSLRLESARYVLQ